VTAATFARQQRDDHGQQEQGQQKNEQPVKTLHAGTLARKMNF
jgi:hypothetical protein